MESASKTNSETASIDPIDDTQDPMVLPNYWAQKGKELIDSDYARLQKINDVCAVLRISSSYFRDVFRVAYGVNPKHYFCLVKINKAKELLSSSSFKICDIAVKVGIPDRNVFRSTFRKFVGATPSEYRNMSLTGENNPRK